MSHLRQSRGLWRASASKSQVWQRHVARCVMARRMTVARLVFGIERCSILCDFDARQAPFTRYNLLSNRLLNRLSNRFDNRLYCVHKHSTGCQRQPAVSCIQPVVTPVVQRGLTISWTNSGCSFNTVVKPVVKRVWQPVWQPAVSCIQTFNRFDNRLNVCIHDTTGRFSNRFDNGFDNGFDNRLYRVNGA